jgi:hypothetical protein
MIWNGGRMLKMFKSEKVLRAIPFLLFVIVIFALAMTLRSVEVSSAEIVETHDMGNGVTCYTFHSSIDCLTEGEK